MHATPHRPALDLLGGSLFGTEIAVAAFAYPPLYRLPDAVHAPVAASLARRPGAAMPFVYAITALSAVADTWLHRGLTGFRLIALSALVYVLAIVLSVVLLVPINNRIAKLDLAAPQAGWLADRRTWDAMHRVRVAALFLAFTLLAQGILG